MTTRTVCGWHLEQLECCNTASLEGWQSPNRVSSEISLENGLLEVDSERGEAYHHERVRTQIPVEVLVELLRHAGYVIVAPEQALEASNG